MNIESLKCVLRGDGRRWIKINGRWVLKKTMLHVYAAVHKNWLNIDWSKKPTLKSMVDEDDWGDPTIWGLNQAMGRCGMFFVMHDMLPEPLEVARKRNGQPYKSGSTKYVKRGTNPSVPSAKILAKPVKDIGTFDVSTFRFNTVTSTKPGNLSSN